MCFVGSGEVHRDRGDGGDQEGAAGQEVQEPGAADHATVGPPEHRGAEALLLLDDGQGRAVPEPGAGVRAGDGVSDREALQPDEPADAAGVREAVHVPDMPVAGVHPQRHRRVPPRHQAAESAGAWVGGRGREGGGGSGRVAVVFVVWDDEGWVGSWECGLTRWRVVWDAGEPAHTSAEAVRLREREGSGEDLLRRVVGYVEGRDGGGFFWGGGVLVGGAECGESSGGSSKV